MKAPYARTAICLALFSACAEALVGQALPEGLPLPRIAAEMPERKASFEFSRRERADIALFIASQSREALVVDGSVRGAASFWFEGDPREALRLFAGKEGLYLIEEEGSLRLSAVRAKCADGLIDIDAESSAPEWIVAAAARAAGKRVIAGKLPDTAISVHARGVSLGRILKVVAGALDGYEAIEIDGVHALRERKPSKDAPHGEPLLRRGEDGLYSIEAQKASLAGILAELFSLEGREYVLLYKSDAAIEISGYRGKCFEEMLGILLKIAACDFVEKEGVRYIFEVQRKDILKGLKESRVIPLSFIPVSDLPSLLPQELASSSF